MKQWRFLGSSVMWWYLRIYNFLEPQNPQKSQPVAAPPLEKLQEFLLRPWRAAAPTKVFDFSKPNLWKLFEQVAVSTYICSNPQKLVALDCYGSEIAYLCFGETFFGATPFSPNLCVTSIHETKQKGEGLTLGMNLSSLWA